MAVGGTPYSSAGHRCGAAAIRIIAGLGFVFMLLPILAIIPLSFNGVSYLSYPLRGVSWQWYAAVFAPTPWMPALWNSVTSYVGFRVSTTGGFFYGWANVTSDTNATHITLNSFGISDVVNGSITAGQGVGAIPEPASSATLLAAGAAGLALYRKRKHLQRAT